MTYWFSADHHFFHANIIHFCSRPFESVEEMNETMVQRWNERVKPEDTIYHLGDFGLGRFEWIEAIKKQLNGKVHLIPGTHDKKLTKLATLFESISDLKIITIEKQKIVLCHYAMRVWPYSHYGSWMLYGHSHGRLPLVPNSLDVRVDTNNFYPYSYDDVRKKIEFFPFQ